MDSLILPSLKEVKEASKRLKDIIVHTPLLKHDENSEIYLKPETLQPVKSFKIRGVFNAVACLTEKQRKNGLSTMSSGNPAISLGWTGRYYDIHAKTFVPTSTAQIKIDTMMSLGMEVVMLPFDEFMEWTKEKGWEKEQYNFIHAWHDRDFLAGIGTIGLEIIEDMPDVETVYIPVGGGGLIAGVGNALKIMKPEINVVGVESEACASLYASFEAGEAVEIERGDTICDGSNVPFITEEMYPLLCKIVDKSVTVSEKAVKRTMKSLMLKHKLIVEGSGALATTAALEESLESRGKSVCVLSGGSIDSDKIVSILSDPTL
jgi:threonine dehydratase